MVLCFCQHIFLPLVLRPVSVHSFNVCLSVPGMATGSEATKPAEAVLEWNKQDNKRMLHAVYRVGNLERTIKYVSVFNFKQHFQYLELVSCF